MASEGSAVNRGERPMSPHLQVYKPQLHSAMSIFHRASGVGNAVGAFLVAWWFVAAASGEGYFALVDGLLSSWFGALLLIGFAASLCYHFANGIRHLVWDAGYGFEKETVHKTGFIAFAVAGVLAVGLILAGILG